MAPRVRTDGGRRLPGGWLVQPVLECARPHLPGPRRVSRGATAGGLGSMNRRGFLTGSAGAVFGAAGVTASGARRPWHKHLKAVLFDAFPLFDPRVVVTLFAARQTGVDLGSEDRKALMSAYVNLQVWPDTYDVLPLLRELGVSLGILSNMTAETLESSLMRANLRSLFLQARAA